MPPSVAARAPLAERPKRLTASIPADDARALELEAEQNDRTVAAEMRIAVREYLKLRGRRT